MKTLVKWAIKKFVSADKIKAAIRSANARLAEREAGDRAARIMGYGNDASELVAAYLAAYANDGRLDEGELAAVNASCDALVEKYLSDEKVEAVVDALLD